MSSQSSVRGGGASNLSVVVKSTGGVVSVALCALLWVLATEPSGVYATNMLVEAVEVAGVSMTSTNHERQSAAMLWVPNIHPNLIL